MADGKIEKRMRLAGTLVGLGLLIQFLTIFWNHPLAFLVFVMAGVPLALAGVLIYLLSVLAASSRPPPPA
jgi:hypothetical protein